MNYNENKKITFIKNFIDAYEKHFKNEKRNDATFENLGYAGYMLDRYFPDFTKDATYYKALYIKCLKFVKKEV